MLERTNMNLGFDIDGVIADLATVFIDLIKEKSHDLIILDVMMNSMDEGFQFAYKLRQDEATKSIPILMSTGVSEASGFKFDPDKDNEDGNYMPVDGYLEKPPKSEELLAKVAELLKE